MKNPLRFSWDPAKNELNVSRRGLSFELAKTFEFVTAIVAEDDRREYGEVREVAFGFIGQRIHSLVFNMRGTDGRTAT